LKNAYDISVVTAVYNAAPFLGETVESLLKQDFGFSRVQLILVDDGSTDGSGALCDGYAKRYPDSVEVVHKQNGGVSSARNEGLKRVRGTYVSFLDADDLLSENALSKVFAFFEAHPETDVVSLPMTFFDGAKGPHLLNFKYANGSRVIDLRKEPKNPQLAVTSAFVRRTALSGKRFDETLKYAEDAKFLQSILIEKKTLGVVADARHLYRRRSTGEASAIQTSGQSPAWYHPYLEGFALDTLKTCAAREGSVPAFVQHTVAYDLQWRMREHVPSALFGADEKASYKALLKEVYSYLDGGVIAAQTELLPYQNGFALALKYGAVPEAYREACRGPLRFEFFTVSGGSVTLECTALLLPGEPTPPAFVLEANGTRITCEPEDLRRTLFLLDEPAARVFRYAFRIPLPDEKTPLVLRVLRVNGPDETPVTAVACGPFFPLSETYAHAYARIADRVLTLENGGLTLSGRTRRRFVREVRFLKELWKKNLPGGRNAVAGRLVYAICKPFQRRPVWLLSDRVRCAGDNGEALFRYLRSLKKKPARLFFAVSERSADYAALKKIGRVVPAKSFRHKLRYLLSDLNISSHADSDVVTPFSKWNAPYRDIENRIPFVFLQHGVIKDDLSDWLNRFRCNIAGFVTSAKPEADSIRDGAYGYTDGQIWLTGLPRFDRLYRDEKRTVTVMPTWRQDLAGDPDPVSGTRGLKKGFTESRFFRFYDALLNDERLIAAAKRLNYRLRFLPHPMLQPHVGLFTKNDAVEFLPADTPYRKVFAESDLILTDYSSVAFDFAYLRKPVVYAQFDRDTFYSGEHVYVKGYFDYERDGFGEVETEYEATVDRLIAYMETGCRLKDAYRARIDGFFAFDDRENCRRVTGKILALAAERQKT
jgi:glycosyltransferase involved in cell wall biosynthesis/CDP-glycerol glycerophosphotransferase (TagB/SpsB family)